MLVGEKSVRRVLGLCAAGIKIQNEEKKTFQDMFMRCFSFSQRSIHINIFSSLVADINGYVEKHTLKGLS